MRVALDTNRYRDLCDGEVEVVRLLEEAESIHVPVVVPRFPTRPLASHRLRSGPVASGRGLRRSPGPPARQALVGLLRAAE